MVIQDLTQTELVAINGGSDDPYDLGYAIGNWIGRALNIYLTFKGAKSTIKG